MDNANLPKLATSSQGHALGRRVNLELETESENDIIYVGYSTPNSSTNPEILPTSATVLKRMQICGGPWKVEGGRLGYGEARADTTTGSVSEQFPYEISPGAYEKLHESTYSTSTLLTLRGVPFRDDDDGDHGGRHTEPPLGIRRRRRKCEVISTPGVLKRKKGDILEQPKAGISTSAIWTINLCKRPVRVPSGRHKVISLKKVSAGKAEEDYWWSDIGIGRVGMGMVGTGLGYTGKD
ncbi:hypothetical protein BGX38DRAFT_1267020 [Terfezia claveryi]|nr:hypothetical protein BGX38DRAFT_1267020 [Terfezia claveryi]